LKKIKIARTTERKMRWTGEEIVLTEEAATANVIMVVINAANMWRCKMSQSRNFKISLLKEIVAR